MSELWRDLQLVNLVLDSCVRDLRDRYNYDEETSSSFLMSIFEITSVTLDISNLRVELTSFLKNVEQDI